jgi:hypothetical protein
MNATNFWSMSYNVYAKLNCFSRCSRNTGRMRELGDKLPSTPFTKASVIRLNIGGSLCLKNSSFQWQRGVTVYVSLIVLDTFGSDLKL